MIKEIILTVWTILFKPKYSLQSNPKKDIWQETKSETK